MSGSRRADPGLDLSRWGVVAPKDNTGFGRMAHDLHRVLGIGRHVVIPSERLTTNPIDAAVDVVLRRDDPERAVRRALDGLQGIIFFEHPWWNPALLPVARRMAIRTVCVPMWEWFRGEHDAWLDCDLFACPTRLTLKVVRAYGWRNAVYLPWCLDIAALAHRPVRGSARVFLHNAGLVDHDDRKGTRDTIRAFASLNRPDLRLIVNIQRRVDLPALPSNIDIRVGDISNHADLYREGDVAIQPSKMEGIGFMVVEPVCCGLPVITTNHPPMNEFVRQSAMLVSASWLRRRAYAGNWVKHAELALPKLRSLARTIASCADQDMESVSSENRRWAEKTFSPERVRTQWERRLGHVVRGRTRAESPALAGG